jgi:hypothetical protein
MITSNDAQEIIDDCKSRHNPAIYLEIYIKILCQRIELKNERIEWHKEQLKQIYKDAK